MDIDYTIIRSPKRRRLAITVERDRTVVVRAPEGVSDERIRRAVDSRRQWIYEKTRHPRKYREPPHPPGKELVSGESALYLGRSHRVEVVESGLSEIRFSGRFYIPASRAVNRKKVLREWYIQRALETIVPRVERCARELGVRYSRVKIVDNRYRWGSCTPNNNIHFNWRLIKAPMFVIDYAIVHELAHLIEADHTPRFWNIVRARSPMMDKARTWLRENGQLLEQDI